MKKYIVPAIAAVIVLGFLGWLVLAPKKSHAPDTSADVVAADQCHTEATEGFGDVAVGTKRQFVHVLAIGTSTTKNIMFIDPVEECTQQEQENVANGGCFFKNAKKEQQVVTLDPSAQFFMQTLHHTPDGNYCWDESVTFGDFFDALAAKDSVFPTLPYAIEITNGLVTKVVERYIP